MRMFFDTSVLVYYVERVEPWLELIRAKLDVRTYEVVISDLTKMEAIVQPIRDGKTSLIANYGSIFATCEIVALSSDLIDRATIIRSHYSFKTPDAIHLAAALEARCDCFFTNDHRLSKFTDLAIELP